MVTPSRSRRCVTASRSIQPCAARRAPRAPGRDFPRAELQGDHAPGRLRTFRAAWYRSSRRFPGAASPLAASQQKKSGPSASSAARRRPAWRTLLTEVQWIPPMPGEPRDVRAPLTFLGKVSGTPTNYFDVEPPPERRAVWSRRAQDRPAPPSRLRRGARAVALHRRDRRHLRAHRRVRRRRCRSEPITKISCNRRLRLSKARFWSSMASSHRPRAARV